jgi:hypothetical protein
MISPLSQHGQTCTKSLPCADSDLFLGVPEWSPDQIKEGINLREEDRRRRGGQLLQHGAGGEPAVSGLLRSPQPAQRAAELDLQ